MYPDTIGWVTINIQGEIERRFPGMPERLVDNLIEPKALISVVPWSRLNSETLPFLIDLASCDRLKCEYNLKRPMRMRNGT